MNKVITLFSIASLSLAVAGCSLDKQTMGTGVGGAVGGVLGAQVGDGSGKTAAIIGGTLLGAIIGGKIGADMDELDRRRAADTLETYPTGRTNTWQNPDTGASYDFTPTRTYNTSGQPCREYDMEVFMDGRREVVTGTACRNSRGEWVNQ
ncbi:RT0821/Lpp0805 family surface protein [Methylophaga sp.]|uniref:RT0821/Lpp0805 family surface protein n=1 Tax=Methylophaga sp. TaxID=2024840 RepID=UPI003F69F8CB